MRHLALTGCGLLLASMVGTSPVAAAPFTLYSNLNVDGRLGAASRPGSPGNLEIETGDDFFANGPVAITGATFIGVLPVGVSVTDVALEIYRVFPKDSSQPPSGNVPTRNNSPSDVALVTRDSASNELSFSTTTLANGFTVGNSVLNGINKKPNQQTLGEGAVTGDEVRFDVALKKKITLPPDHYFFIPQVELSSGNFFWASASRPISGVGSTPINPDLQAWIRNADLDPDWLRIGTDIIGGVTPPTFNMAYQLTAQSIPEPATLLLMGTGLALYSTRRRMKHFR